MKSKTQKFDSTPAGIDALSEAVTEYLADKGCTGKEALRYRLLAEETMLRWSEGDASGESFGLSFESKRGYYSFTLTRHGPSIDPFSPTGEDHDITSAVVRRLQNDAEYKYTQGENRLICSVFTDNNYHLLRVLTAVALPFAMQLFMSGLLSASDSVMLGFLDQNSLSGSALAGRITFIYSQICCALMGGLGILAAQYWSRKDRCSVEQLFAAGMQISTAFSVLVWALSFFMPGQLMRVFTPDSAIIQQGSEYLKVLSWSFLLMSFTQFYHGILRSTGKGMRSTEIGTVSMLLNIGLNYLLIFGGLGLPAMGIRGAALATVVARLVEFVLLLAESMKKNAVRLRMKSFLSVKLELRKTYLRIAVPMVLSQLVWVMSQFVIPVIIGHLGSDAVAANSMSSTVMGLLSCVYSGLAVGSAVILGSQLGKENFSIAEDFAKKLIATALVTGLITGLLLVAISADVVKLMGTFTPEARRLLYIMLHVDAIYAVTQAFSALLCCGIMNAGGLTKQLLVIDAVNLWAIIIPVSLIAAFVIKAPVIAVFIIIHCDEITKTPVLLRMYRKKSWLKKL